MYVHIVVHSKMHVSIYHFIPIYLLIIKVDYSTKSEHKNLRISTVLRQKTLFIANCEVFSSKFTPSTRLHHLLSYSRHKLQGTNRWHLGGTGWLCWFLVVTWPNLGIYWQPPHHYQLHSLILNVVLRSDPYPLYEIDMILPTLYLFSFSWSICFLVAWTPPSKTLEGNLIAAGIRLNVDLCLLYYER